MNIQGFIDTMNEMDRKTRSRYHLTLGKAIELLSTYQPSVQIIFDFDNKSPGDTMSYRGYYSDIAITSIDNKVSVGEFLGILKESLGSIMEGYKGGDYKMTNDTPLWASEYGDASGLAIMDIIDRDGIAIIETRKIE